MTSSFVFRRDSYMRSTGQTSRCYWAYGKACQSRKDALNRLSNNLQTHRPLREAQLLILGRPNWRRNMLGTSRLVVVKHL
ncbi:hypothetical protein WJX79_010541 [Trebouxia sp. C0005]